jgi:hypothetical protein
VDADWREKVIDLKESPLPRVRQDWKNGPAIAGCALTTARRTLVAGSPRPKAETGRRADPTPSCVEGEGNAHFYYILLT